MTAREPVGFVTHFLHLYIIPVVNALQSGV